MSGGSKPYIVGGRISPKGVVLAALPTQALRRLVPQIRHKKPTGLSEVGTALRGVSTLLGQRGCYYLARKSIAMHTNWRMEEIPTPKEEKSEAP